MSRNFNPVFMRKILPILSFLFLFSVSSLYAQGYPPLQFNIANVTSPASGTVDVNLTAGSNWQNITRFEGTFVFNPSIITWNSMANWGLSNPAGATFTLQSPGVLRFTWMSLITVGPTLSSGTTIFTLRFNVVGSPGNVSPVTFDGSAQAMFWNNGFGWSGTNFAVGNGSVTLVCAAPSAAFTTTPNLYNITFNDGSTGATSYLWDFGDGGTSTLQSPSHTYASSGTYTVCQIVTNVCGADTTCSTINVCPLPNATFTQTPNQLAVSFNGASPNNPTTWSWNFGDGSTATTQNPSHNYAMPGTYTVCLIVGNGCAFDTTCQSITVGCPSPSAMWSDSVAGLDVFFSDNSPNNPTSWFWDFGDGTFSSLQFPVHSYAQAGTYTVCLSVSSICGSDSSCATVTTLCPVPSAAFSNTLTGNTASFSDQSSGNPTAWAWNFGDGSTATIQNPNHTYLVPGIYTVCLIASSSCGADTSCMQLNVNCAAPSAAFIEVMNGFAAQFSDLSTNSPNAWAWDFGDGNTSNVQNPLHGYAAAGTYNVCLIATNVCGSDTSCHNVEAIIIGIEAGVAGLQIAPNPANDWVKVSLENGGSIAITVFGLRGEKLGQFKGNREIMLSTEVLPRGIYFLEVATENGTVVKKLILR